MNERLATLLTEAFLAEERCLTSDEPCRSNECATCVFAGVAE